MQAKSTRGVQQEDVWAAADSLIAEGLRPTIERVRLKIGRGSPNTVSPMLETWFATLGPRLGVSMSQSQTKEPGQLPPAVQQAMSKMWETVLTQSQQAASQGIAEAHNALVTERAELDGRETELARRDRSLDERELTMSEALTLAKNQLMQTALQVQELQNTAALRSHALVETQSALAEALRQRDSDRQHFDQQAIGQADAMRRAQAQAASNEQRLTAEIDRARQELKKAQAAQADLTRRIETLSTDKEKTIEALNGKWHATQLEAAALREKLASQNSRLAELQYLLQQQTLTTHAAIERVGRFSTRISAKTKSLNSRKLAGLPRKA